MRLLIRGNGRKNLQDMFLVWKKFTIFRGFAYSVIKQLPSEVNGMRRRPRRGLCILSQICIAAAVGIIVGLCFPSILVISALALTVIAVALCRWGDKMKIVVVKAPSFMRGLLRALFGIHEQEAWIPLYKRPAERRVFCCCDLLRFFF